MRKFVTIAVLVGALIGCATSGHKFEWRDVDALKPGMTVAEVETKLGKTNGVSYMPDSTTVRTWIYAQGTALGTGHGRGVKILFDADGRMVRLLQRSDSEIH
jgi:outer membrane protein assembly factor BamE (lipoprotein component of BamABCDE complex)